MQISVIGAGRWGSFLAYYCSKILDYDTVLYGRKGSKRFEQLKTTGKNEYVVMPENITYTDDLAYTLNHAHIIIISVGAQTLRALLEEIRQTDLYQGKTFVLCMKGLETATQKRLSEVFDEVLDGKAQCGVWVGPGHVECFVKGIPNCMVIDSTNLETTKKIVEIFSSELIRLYIGTDLIGSEVGAAAKNVIGIAAGMLDAFGYESLKGALMARGAREIARLIKAMGGNELSAYGLCHLGDYEATLFSPYSHNRTFGEKFIKGERYDKLSEGIYTAKALNKIAKEKQVDLPICSAVYKALEGQDDPKAILMNLFIRPVKSEFE